MEERTKKWNLTRKRRWRLGGGGAPIKWNRAKKSRGRGNERTIKDVIKFV